MDEENGLSNSVINVGQELSITTMQEVDCQVHFETMTQAGMGEQAWLLITTRHMRGSVLYPALRESSPARLGDAADALPCQWQGADPAQPQVLVGAMVESSDYLNRHTLADTAVIAFTLLPRYAANGSTWRDALNTAAARLYPELRGDGPLGFRLQSQEVLRIEAQQLTVSGRRKRIPEGDYELRWHTTSLASVKKFNLIPLLFNDQVAESRCILIHNGNYPRDTDGCLLVGSRRSTDFVGNSQTHYTKLLRCSRRVGIDSVMLRISSDYPGPPSPEPPTPEQRLLSCPLLPHKQ